MLTLNWHLAREHSPNFELCRALHRRFVRNSANGLSVTFPRRVLSTKARIDKRLSDTWTDPPARLRHYQTESDPDSVASNRPAPWSRPGWRQNILRLRPTRYRDTRYESPDRATSLRPAQGTHSPARP